MRLDAFRGRWTIERTIEDIRGGRSGSFEGTATFTADAGELAYHESGSLRLGDAGPFAATRSYRWRAGGAGTIEVMFPDGRVFHRFLAEEPQPAAVHHCPPDVYRVRYDFARWPRWRAEWRVRGPAKHYRLVSLYCRAGQAGETAA